MAYNSSLHNAGQWWHRRCQSGRRSEFMLKTMQEPRRGSPLGHMPKPVRASKRNFVIEFFVIRWFLIFRVSVVGARSMARFHAVSATRKWLSITLKNSVPITAQQPLNRNIARWLSVRISSGMTIVSLEAGSGKVPLRGTDDSLIMTKLRASSKLLHGL